LHSLSLLVDEMEMPKMKKINSMIRSYFFLVNYCLVVGTFGHLEWIRKILVFLYFFFSLLELEHIVAKK